MSIFAKNNESDGMKYFKEYYTREELNELVTWFDERMDRLPQQFMEDLVASGAKGLPAVGD